MESQRFAEKSENASITAIQQDVVIELVKQGRSQSPSVDEVLGKTQQEKDHQQDVSQQKLLDEKSFYKAMTGVDDVDYVSSSSLAIIDEMKQDMIRQSKHLELVADVKEKQRDDVERER